MHKKTKTPLQPPTKEGTDSIGLSTKARHRQQREVIKLFGTIKFDPNFDYKVERARR